ncbi:MAG: helix-turn-helix domain-containing protein, partial [Lentisphaeria bacterium]|nr:helix-turn-helix domain-containing protein [Lentisphaeria bacterium]
MEKSQTLFEMDGLGDDGLAGVVKGAAVSRINCRCHVVTDEGLRSVFLDGRALLAYDVGDKVSERIAIVQLYTSGHAMEQDLAVAFGHNASTIRRWVRRWERSGFDGLLDKARTCKPYKMKGRDGAVRRMVAKGLDNCGIARRLGVDESTIRLALKRLGIRREKAVETTLPGLEEAPASEPVSESPVAPAKEHETAPEATHTHTASDSSVPPPSTDSDPSERSGDRALAAAGALDDAPPLFGDADAVPGAGVLLAVPAIVESGVLDSFRETYGTLGPAFHGLRTMVMTTLFMLLLRIRRPEHLRHGRPTDLGRALGLDRAAEVKTVRRKLKILAGRKRGHELVTRVASRRLEEREDNLGYVYLDGHVRMYCGKRNLPKTHIARLNCVGRGETETWVNDEDGEPLFVVTGDLNPALTEELERLVEQMEALLPEGVRPMLVFDRGGW